ncbi:hypothetical protein H6P81_012683 [Aristolochia fimbriata]|uniref:MADS-box domain-containing protein n=1 Tax=Aristolochia fimbriata TaxID=158543 RepID=A0AAV7ECI3_ARIFI|nr:hypothetical protein H6P81_012683 [Aristolochia fimbriata]
MGRAKVPAKRIADEKKRRLTFKKRKEGLKKKMHEFSTLCGVRASMICFGADGDQSEVVLWPEEPGRVEEVIREYRKVEAEERGRRNSDLSSYLTQRMKKEEEELLQRRRANASVACPPWDSFLNQSSEDELLQLRDYLQRKIEIVENVIGRAKEMQILKSGDQMDDHENNRDYYLDMEKPLKLECEPAPMPISFIDQEICSPSMLYGSTSVPNLPSSCCSYVNNDNRNLSMPQQGYPCYYSSPHYSIFETEDFVSDTLEAFSGNYGFFPLLGDSSSKQTFSLPESSASMQHPGIFDWSMCWVFLFSSFHPGRSNSVDIVAFRGFPFKSNLKMSSTPDKGKEPLDSVPSSSLIKNASENSTPNSFKKHSNTRPSRCASVSIAKETRNGKCFHLQETDPVSYDIGKFPNVSTSVRGRDENIAPLKAEPKQNRKTMENRKNHVVAIRDNRGRRTGKQTRP